jgi:hypothetical protein
MAKRRKYYMGDRRDQRRSRRKWVLGILVVMAVGIAIWRVTYQKQLPGVDEAALLPQTTGADEPVLFSAIPPDSHRLAVQDVPAVNATQIRHTQPVPSEDVTTPVLEPKPASPEVSEPDPHANSQARQWYQQGREAKDAGDVITARTRLTQAVKTGDLDSIREKEARLLLNSMSQQWLLSRNIFDNDPHCSLYKVKSGDRLSLIGSRHKVPYRLLMRINGIEDATKLQAGESIKVVTGPFHAKVNRDRFIISVYLGDTLVHTWPVGLGSPGRHTPKGKWLVETGKKQINPAWWDREEGKHYLPDDPENPLGERWIGLHGEEGEAVGRDGFGIHGTIRPEEIGKAASRGCIRLYNKDVAVLYDLLAEGQSFVWVED